MIVAHPELVPIIVSIALHWQLSVALYVSLYFFHIVYISPASVFDVNLIIGKSKYTAMDIMRIILDQEERQTPASSTASYTIHTPTQPGASMESKASVATSGKRSFNVPV